MMYYKRLYGRSIIGVYLDKLGFEKYYIYCLIILFIWLYTGYFSVLLWGVLLLSILGILKEKSPKIDYYYKLIQSLIFIIMLVLSLTSYYFFEELEFISLGRSYLQCIVLKTRQATCVVPEIYFKHWLVDPHTKRYEGVYMVKKQNSFKEEMKIMKKCIEKDKGTVESINKKKDDDSYNVLLKQGEHYTLRIRKYKSFDIFEYQFQREQTTVLT
ncbi:hypothetical protein AAAY24_13560 [Faecalibacillus faecis]|uniref:hypothetical protein n=1 Tax=Faecalibacillus faecis TaxID=1982628 RepID=UPI0032BFA740|nr:hypothetical protein [Coprobacillus sp.]